MLKSTGGGLPGARGAGLLLIAVSTSKTIGTAMTIITQRIRFRLSAAEVGAFGIELSLRFALAAARLSRYLVQKYCCFCPGLTLSAISFSLTIGSKPPSEGQAHPAAGEKELYPALGPASPWGNKEIQPTCACPLGSPRIQSSLTSPSVQIVCPEHTYFHERVLCPFRQPTTTIG